jgi:hypothetical protein
MLALDGLLDVLPDALVGPEARRRLRRAGRALPDGLSTTIALEARLDDDPQVDLGLLVRSERELAVLVGADPVIALPPDGAGPARWRTATSVATRPTPGASDVGQLSPWLWLEFDLRDDGPMREPGVFAVTSPEGLAPAVASWDPTPAVAAVVAAQTAPPADAVTEVIVHLVRRRFVVCQVGLFPARPLPAVRLFCLVPAGLGAEDLVDALVAGGWRGPRPELVRWARTCTGWRAKIYLHLDVTADGILPAVGIDVPFAGTPPAWARPRWGAMLPDLLDAGLCLSAKRRAVEELPAGYDVEAFGRRRYHVDLLSAKVTVRADGSAQAKAYVMASH